jgi:hypothetical protein
MGLFLSELTLAISQRTFGLYSETCLIRHYAEPNNYVGILGGKYYKSKFCSQFGQFNNAFIFFCHRKDHYYPRKNNIDTQIERKYLFSSSLPPVECRRAHVLYTLSVFACAYRGGSRGGRTRRAPPLKLEKIWCFGVKSCFFTRNTPNIFARRNFLKCAPLTWNPGSAPGIVVSNTYCVVFLLCFFFVLCTLCCQCLWIVHIGIL